jgi:hypothetical protein
MQPQSNGKPFSSHEFILGIIAMTLFSMACLLNHNINLPKIEVLKQDSAVTLNRNLLKFFNLGNKRLIADIVWIQTLIEGDEEHYSKLDLNSWMYHRFMSIADMDPYFYENYLHGGMYLSIVKDDPLGASELFERGLNYYPADYRLNYNMGYNLVFEIGNKEKGLKYFEKILHDKNLPSYFPSLINKLRFEVHGDYEAAMIFLKNRLDQTQDSYIQKKIRAEIYALKTEKDLNCLNRRQKNCNRLDDDGEPYQIDKDKIWFAKKNVRKYRLNHQQKK